MSTALSEDHHESKKPRSPQSQADILKRLGADIAVGSDTESDSESDSSSSLGEKLASPKHLPAEIHSRSKKDYTYGPKERSRSFSKKFSSLFRSNKEKDLPALSSGPFTITIPNHLNIRVEMATVKDYKRVSRTLMAAFEDDPFTNYILNTRKITRENTSKANYKKKKMDLMRAYFDYVAYESLTTDGVVFVIKDNLFESMMEDVPSKQKSRFPYLGVSCWHKIFGKNVETFYSSVSSEDSDDSEDYSDDDFFASESMSRISQLHPSVLRFNMSAFFKNCRSKIMKDKWPFLTKVRNDVLINKLMREADADVTNPTIDIWYLSDIATLPIMKGKGLGKLLLNHVIEDYIYRLDPQAYVYLESSNPANRGFYTKMDFKVLASYSMRKKRYVDEHKILEKDPTNKGVNMDAMVRHPKKM